MRRHATIDRAAVRGLVLAGTCAAVLAGCQKALFPQGETRTQFETNDRLRRGFVPLEEPDVFGNPQPALRERLTQPQ
ncbi:MAG: hypothetical protein IID28_00770 [Planctomycetes bacterium]|nr:hypothetical protein [Planctomycetota bacterium]